MRKLLLNLAALLLAVTPLAVSAQLLDKANVPEVVMEQLYKRHPNALDVVIEQKNHFKQDLYLIEFKDHDETKMEYFRNNGHFFVAGVLVASPKTSEMLPLNNAATLTAAFSNYDITKAIMVINPNGVGEEFDFIIHNAEGDWDASMDRKGNVTARQKR